jgi:hypothetical protein
MLGAEAMIYTQVLVPMASKRGCASGGKARSEGLVFEESWHMCRLAVFSAKLLLLKILRSGS